MTLDPPDLLLSRSLEGSSTLSRGWDATKGALLGYVQSVWVSDRGFRGIDDSLTSIQSGEEGEDRRSQTATILGSNLVVGECKGCSTRPDSDLGV